MDTPDSKNIDYQRGTVSAVDLHDAARREPALHRGEEGGVGLAVLAVCALILIFGGGHLFSTSNGFGSSIYVSDHYVPEPRPDLGGGADDVAQAAWIDRWMSDGKKVYANCVACHQATGLGVTGQFPPLVGSEWVDGGTTRLAAILLHGINGPFTVAGRSYSQLMPAWNTLGDEQIAQVITYIRREFGSLPEGADGVVTTEMIQGAREELSGKTNPYTEAELLAIPADASLPGAKVDLQTGEPLP